MGKPYNELHFKEYGKRKFSYSYKSDTSKMQATFGYTIKCGALETRYITAETTNYLSSLCNVVVEDKTIKDSKTDNINEKVTAEVIFKATMLQAIAGGHEMDKFKFDMSVEQLAESQHPTICGMNVRQRAQVYQKTM